MQSKTPPKTEKNTPIVIPSECSEPRNPLGNISKGSLHCGRDDKREETTKQFPLSDSFIGKLTQKLCFPIISEFLILASIILFWYEGFLTKVGLSVFGGFVAPTLLILALLMSDKAKIKIAKSTLLLILFLVWGLLAGCFAVWRGVSPVLVISGLALFGQFVVAILAGQGVAKPTRLLKNIIYAAVPMILVGAYQFITRQATSALWITPAESSISTRAFAFFGSPNVLGAVLAIVALTALGVSLKYRDKIMAAVSILAIVVLVFTFSRSAWVGLIAGIIFILLMKNWWWIILTPLSAFSLLLPSVRERLAVLFTTSYWLDSSLDGRLWAMNNAFHLWSKYPLIGSGPGTYGGKLAQNFASSVYLQGIQNGYVALYYTDNQWLQLLVQTGIVGIILFALFAVNVFVEFISKYNKGKSWVTLGTMGAFASFIVAGFFGNVLEFGAVAVPMGIIVGIVRNEE